MSQAGGQTLAPCRVLLSQRIVETLAWMAPYAITSREYLCNPLYHVSSHMWAPLSRTRAWTSRIPTVKFTSETINALSASFSSLPSSTDDKPVPELPPFAYTPPPYTGPSKADVLSMRKEFMNPAIFHFYKVRSWRWSFSHCCFSAWILAYACFWWCLPSSGPGDDHGRKAAVSIRRDGSPVLGLLCWDRHRQLRALSSNGTSCGGDSRFCVLSM